MALFLRSLTGTFRKQGECLGLPASLHGVDSTVGTQKLPLDPRESQGLAKVLPGRAECSASTAAWSDMPHRWGESPENSDRP